MSYPQQIRSFEALVKARFPNAVFKLDAPAATDGSWWLDLELSKARRTTLSWSERAGFGFYGADAGYGERPNELHRDPNEAFLRLERMMSENPSGRGPGTSRAAPANPR